MSDLTPISTPTITSLDKELFMLLLDLALADYVTESRAEPKIKEVLAKLTTLILEARLDEIDRLAVSNKSGSDFDGWQYLDDRTQELRAKLGVN